MACEVEELTWPKFLGWFHQTWKRGQHLCAISPTGSGKTTFVGGILPLRRFVIALDPKGGDSTLGATGFERLTSWPPSKKDYESMADGNPYRRILGPENPRYDDMPKVAENFRQALRDIFEERHWTVFVPDLQIAVDPRIMDLRAQLDRHLIAARDREVSVITDFQGPSWVNPAASREATWVATSYTRDTDVVGRMAEILGRPRPEVKGVVSAIPQHGWALVGRNPREPYRVTIPHPLSRR